jgi:hypothetical protein
MPDLVSARAPEPIRNLIAEMRASQLVTLSDEEITVRVPHEAIRRFDAEGKRGRLLEFLRAYLRAEAGAAGWKGHIFEFWDAPREQQVLTIRSWYR